MDDRQKKIIEKLGLKEESFEPKREPSTIKISREDFDLLDVEEDGAMYYITEADGTITIRKGENK